MKFELNGLLLRAADNQRQVTIQADTLGTAIIELTIRFPQIRRVLLDNSGQLRQAHRVIVNGELTPRPDTSMSLTDDDQIEFFTAVAGG